MQITVNIPQAEALRRGSARWGAQSIDLEAVLAVLAEEERMQIEVDGKTGALSAQYASLNWNGGSPQQQDLKSSTTETTDVVAAIRTSLAAVAEVAEQKRTKAHEKLSALIEDPSQHVWDSGRPHYEYDGDNLSQLAKTAGVDVAPYKAALAAGIERVYDKQRRWLREVYDPARTDYPSEIKSPWGGGYHNRVTQKERALSLDCDDVVTRIDTYMAELAEIIAVAEERKDASSQTWIKWARCYGSEDLRAAIANDYPLGERVEREVVGMLLPTAPSDLLLDRGIGAAADDGERRVPNTRAREGHEALTQAVADNTVPFPGGTEIVIGRIRALSWDESCDCGPYSDCEHSGGEIRMRRTGIPVTIRALHHEVTAYYVVSED